MVYIHKILANNALSHNFTINLQIYKSTNLWHFFRNMNMTSTCRSVQDSGVASATSKSDLKMLHHLRFEYPENLLCGYLNINSLRNKTRGWR